MAGTASNSQVIDYPRMLKGQRPKCCLLPSGWVNISNIFILFLLKKGLLLNYHLSGFSKVIQIIEENPPRKRKSYKCNELLQRLCCPIAIHHWHTTGSLVFFFKLLRKVLLQLSNSPWCKSSLSLEVEITFGLGRLLGSKWKSSNFIHRSQIAS